MHLVFTVLLFVYWLVASDFHVEPRPIGPRPLHLGHDTDWSLFDSTVAAMRKAAPNSQVVILPGDFLAHHFPDDIPLAKRTMARIVRTFNAAFPRAQFLIALGNNDDPCGDYRTAPATPYFSYIAHLWAPLVNRNGAAPHFQSDFANFGWYSARLPIKGVRAIALDSVYWSTFYRPCSNTHPKEPQHELQWFAQSLASMPRGSRVVVVMHIPPGVDARSTLVTHRLFIVSFLQSPLEASLLGELGRHASRIPFVIAGHVHRGDFRLFEDVPILIAPSISPSYYNNPTFLRLDVGVDGSLRDYRPFYYDFDTRTWDNADTFDRTYRVNAFSPGTLAAIHARLGTDDGFRARWAQASVSESRYPDITSKTWRVYWCAQAQLGESFSKCAGVQRRFQVLVITVTVATAGVIVLIAIATALLRRERRRA